MPLRDVNHVEEVGASEINRYLDAGYHLLNVSNYAKAAKRGDGTQSTRRGVSYVVGWRPIITGSVFPPNLREEVNGPIQVGAV
mgnify:CR=1 FL=1